VSPSTLTSPANPGLRVPGGDPSFEDRFRRLVESVIDYGIFILDPQGRVMSWNSGAGKLQGYTADEIVGQHFSIFYPPELVASGWPDEELRRAVEFGRLEDEGWRIRKDGSRFWANVTITPIHDGQGRVAGFAKITHDLTERRAHEEALRISEERFRLLVSSVRDYAIFMLDEDGFIRSWNSGAQAIYGYTPAEAIGRHFGILYTPHDQQARKTEIELAAARNHGRCEDEGWRVRKDGTLYWADVVITAMHGPQQHLLGFAKVTRDMTERRRLEELERSSRRMNEFLAMLAHELRNPLAPIRNAVTVMQLEPLESPTLRNCRDIIHRQLTHVTRLVDDLLDIGRLASGKIKLRPEVLSLSEVVSRSVEAARPLVESRHHRLQVVQPPAPVFVNGDGTRLAQILQNLLVNAAKYTPDGGRIVIRVQPGEGHVHVTVEDNGRGIAPDELEAIFELFRQGGEHTPNESGLGIGLTLARSLAEMHGGSLEARSAGPGHGSSFTLRLPTVPPKPSEDSDPAERPPGGQRVLVVDDNRDAADTTAAVLRMLGHEAGCAYSGAEALALAPDFSPQVVILDLAMPDMSGFEALAGLRRQAGGNSRFVVAMTGYGAAEDRQRTRDAGFDAHLTKPVELDALVKLLGEAGGRATG